jgi:hypothetical protein
VEVSVGDEVTRNLNTDWTAQRMVGYLSHYKKLRLEEVADEMLAILSDRNRIMQKKEMESSNARWNDYLNNGFDDIEAVDDFMEAALANIDKTMNRLVDP